jgi:spore coat polysaccharide biosynthesis predicted glycosyltransferase SpsG
MADTGRILKGPSYCLVRPAFGRTVWRGASATHGVVIVAGSGPRAGQWGEIVTGDGIDRGTWGPLTVVVGQTFARLDALRDQCARIGADLKIGVTAETLAETLASRRLALITGGVIVYEAMAVGVPAVVIPQVENLIAEAKWFAAHGCIHDLGFDAGMNPAVVASAVTRLLTDQQLANDMSTQSRRTIDGRGIIRAAAAITDLLRASARTS